MTTLKFYLNPLHFQCDGIDRGCVSGIGARSHGKGSACCCAPKEEATFPGIRLLRDGLCRFFSDAPT